MGANFNFNKVILGGRLTAQPELKTTPSGTTVTSFSIAVNRKRAKEGEQQSDFINCVAWKERAEFICKYFGKGSSISIVGELQTRQWKDNNGNNRYATEVLVSEVNFVDSKSDNAPASAPSYMPDAYKTPAETGYQEMDSGDDLPF
jgi:single-strand DNA-binding protein